MNFNNIISKFDISGQFVSCEPYGNGHINDTYLAVMDNKNVKTNYILQRLNRNVFPRTKELMDNVQKVTTFLRERIRQDGGNPDREALTLIPLKDGKSYYIDNDGNYFRMYIFIEKAVGLQLVEDPKIFEGAGRAFGAFINKLNDFPAEQLDEVIFNFHNTAARLDNFMTCLGKDFEKRSLTCKSEIDFVLSRKDYCSRVVDLLKSGGLPLRVTHNDTKLNNVLLDEKTGAPICVIDLDTIMPGSLLYDFGDAIRSGCNTGLEDEKDLSKVNFDIKLFEAFCKGFMSGIGNCITTSERDLLAFGAILMTFECGIRFLSDYLDGDNYFKTHYDDHNLVRCRTQFKLVSDMEKVLDKMNKIVKENSAI